MAWARTKQIFGIDLRSLAIFRIALASILVYDWLSRALDFRAHYLDFGLFPRGGLIEKSINADRFSLFLISGQPFLTGFLFACGTLAAIALLTGYRTRTASIASWILLVSVQVRNPAILQGGDDLLRLLSFWSMFLPLGARFGIDSSLHPQQFPASKSYISVASAALLLQLAMMYATTGVLKSGAEWRVDYTAIMYTLQLEAFQRPAGLFLRQFPELCRLLTRGVVYFELYGPLLLFFPVLFLPARLAGILGFIGLQAGLFSCMRLGHFPFVSTSALIPFVPSQVWDFLLARYPKKMAQLAMPWTHLLSPNFLGKRLKHLADYHIRPFRSHWSLELIVFYLLSLVILWNVNNCKKWYFPESQRNLVYTLYLDQNWAMFAPKPLDTNGWFDIKGQLVNGTTVFVDHFAMQKEPNAEQAMSDFYGRERWRKYFLVLASGDSNQYLYYGRYLCRKWNDTEANKEEQLKTFKINFHSQLTLPTGLRAEEKVKLVWEHRCFD